MKLQILSRGPNNGLTFNVPVCSNLESPTFHDRLTIGRKTCVLWEHYCPDCEKILEMEHLYFYRLPDDPEVVNVMRPASGLNGGVNRDSVCRKRDWDSEKQTLESSIASTPIELREFDRVKLHPGCTLELTVIGNPDEAPSREEAKAPFLPDESLQGIEINRETAAIIRQKRRRESVSANNISDVTDGSSTKVRSGESIEAEMIPNPVQSIAQNYAAAKVEAPPISPPRALAFPSSVPGGGLSLGGQSQVPLTGSAFGCFTFQQSQPTEVLPLPSGELRNQRQRSAFLGDGAGKTRVELNALPLSGLGAGLPGNMDRQERPSHFEEKSITNGYTKDSRKKAPLSDMFAESQAVLYNHDL